MNWANSISAAELASKLQAECIGDSSIQLTGINEIHCVKNGDVTFCDNSKYIKKALASAASCVLVNERVEAPSGKVLLLMKKPFSAFTKLSQELRGSFETNEMVSSSSEIGDGTVIMPGAFVGKNVQIGSNSFIHPNVTIYDGCFIGNNVIIHAGTVIGADAFYYQRNEGYNKLRSCGTVRIENDVEIGANCTIDRGVTSETVIGAGTKIDNLVQIGHDTTIGRNCLFASQVGIAGVVTVEDDVILWGQVGVQKDLTIGKGAVVLGQSGLAKSLKGGITYFGSPVREAREKMKELALVKQLPSIIEKLRR
ncbi:MAG TPA: UDP-3-O-(3-hydroxymyristoyl)glucosamine N-acyltransferase [Flavobacteriales bacterium]|nr:UDP-3-O-(3-hydroxymyristoyl)glucosamine N-acyltransferase [Flavobacteriales bacterium]